MTACSERECTGTVVDGYCDVCGAKAEDDARETSHATMAAGTAPDRSGRSRFRAVSTSARGRLGAGLVTIPPIPRGDPMASILTDPRVPEPNRFCGNSECRKPVGRATDGTDGAAEGFCAVCGTRYSFVPRLGRGELVGGQYEVQGCIAHGGLGWIYLAIDRNVSDRWVVLKGLINSGDESAMAAAASEVLTLAEVEHPNIVRIHNFVEHVDAQNTDPVGYIVMEYIGGITLKELRKSHRGPLPADHAVAYILEIASALDYLHTQGFAYCDFKPDNVMQTDEQVKLIDLGAVIAMDDYDSPIFGTLGYQAPEIARTGATVATDVYTVGRTLAVLVMDVPQANGRFVHHLPDPELVPVFARHESLYRAIMRATDLDPRRRFASMAEFADQLTGVLHEIVAAETGVARSRVSSQFSPQRAVFGAGQGVRVDALSVVAALPVPIVDPNDSGAAALATASGTLPAQLEQALDLAGEGPAHGRDSSVEIPLRLIRAALELGAPADARARLGALKSAVPDDWRLAWYSGQCALLEDDFITAAGEFDAVWSALPGELGPKLAIAAAAELRGLHDRALRYYEVLWRTEHTYYSAAFGVARQRARSGDREQAIAPLDEIPVSSAHFNTAGVMAIDILLDGLTPESLDEQTLLDAGARVDALTIESDATRATMRLRVFEATLKWLQAGHVSAAPLLLGVDFDVPGVRRGMETCYRQLARSAGDMWERIALVENANRIRPRSRL